MDGAAKDVRVLAVIARLCVRQLDAQRRETRPEQSAQADDQATKQLFAEERQHWVRCEGSRFGEQENIIASNLETNVKKTAGMLVILHAHQQRVL